MSEKESIFETARSVVWLSFRLYGFRKIEMAPDEYGQPLILAGVAIILNSLLATARVGHMDSFVLITQSAMVVAYTSFYLRGMLFLLVCDAAMVIVGCAVGFFLLSYGMRDAIMAVGLWRILAFMAIFYRANL